MPQNFRVVQNLLFSIQKKFSVYDVRHHTDLWSVNSNQIQGMHSISPNFPFDCRWLDLDKAVIEIFGLSCFSPVFSKLTCCEGGSRCSPVSVADDMEVCCCVGGNKKVEQVMRPILYYSIVILHDMSAVIGDCWGLSSLSGCCTCQWLTNVIWYFLLYLCIEIVNKVWPLMWDIRFAELRTQEFVQPTRPMREHGWMPMWDTMMSGGGQSSQKSALHMAAMRVVILAQWGCVIRLEHHHPWHLSEAALWALRDLSALSLCLSSVVKSVR